MNCKGAGGTVNMDWWFTNRGIILDTAGSMIFNEARAGERPSGANFCGCSKRRRPQSHQRIVSGALHRKPDQGFGGQNRAEGRAFWPSSWT